MLIILMRHGEAVPYQTNDQSRQLTDFGISQSLSAGLRLAELLKSRDVPSSVDKALVSPYIRAQQTFSAVREHVKFEDITDTDAITPMSNLQSVHDIIDGYAQGSSPPAHLMLVTHMPLVSLLADKICHGFNGKIFDTADILIIEYDPDTHTGSQVALLESVKKTTN
ncbi:phosphohistidine phosphatase SixA [Ningiella sp. W23]|uniref:phosphohistidine phosphatase SixA n=1 Tax=Ningiella sp. W23 TaxID=3023715 RepID=UPI0037568892